MELKNAVAVCLISFCSATLVVLIARALDVQAAARLEPQLAAIVAELRAIRGQGGLAAAVDGAGQPAEEPDGLIVYYFHSATRCPTCRSIESQARDVVQTGFAAELASGAVRWRVMNYEEPSGAPLAARFGVQMPVVVLARMEGGQLAEWKSLDRVWALVSDGPAYAAFVAGEIRGMLAGPRAEPAVTSDPASQETADLPIPDAGEIPLPDDLPAPE